MAWQSNESSDVILKQRQAMTVISDVHVKAITSWIEHQECMKDHDRFVFDASDNQSYCVDLHKVSSASEGTVVSLIRDAFCHNKLISIWYEPRNGRRWVKAINLHH